ncbi:hypothetical protein J5Y04_09090 [Kitasatospora sp. RG8]|uniref:hypothetical protein n=1 Tax=Kitasatospora sp. RG8 TaxID=2820815 RepID=UPI001ADEDDCF|nr:hypothetical protein [Kitasatospora sp. RG8]MBP0449707.1 hypothetical protein [Kitasatospora sp. RG8]
MSVKRILIPGALLVLGAAALTGCSGGPVAATPAPKAVAAVPSAVSSAVPSAAPSAVPSVAPAAAASPAPAGAPAETPTGAPAAAPVKAPAAAPTKAPVARPTAAPAGTGSQGGASRPGKPAAPAAPAGAPAPGPTPYCTAAQLAVTATPAPAGRLLLTARNASTSPCDLGLIGLVTFDGGTKAAVPDGLGGGPNILKPGESGYEAVELVRPGAPGSGANALKLMVTFDGGATVTVDAKAFVHGPSVDTWRPTAADAVRP